MKLKLVLLSLLTAFSAAQAASNSETIKTVLEAQISCSNFVRYDSQNIYLGFGAYKLGVEEPRSPIPGAISVAPLNGSPAFTLNTKDSAIDVVTSNNQAVVLTYTSIEEWNLNTRERTAEYPTYAIAGPLEYKQHAEAMALYNDKLIMAHGRLGVSIFNLKTKRLSNQFRLVRNQLPLESMATGVTVQGHFAYILMDNFSLVPAGQKQAFRGIIVIDLNSETVVAQLDGIDPGSDSILSDSKRVIISYGGIPIWKYDISALRGSQMPEPLIRIWRFPTQGHPTGAATMDDKYYYTCFSKAPAFPGDNGGVFRRVPMALDRRVLILD
jgi:hypothetical protein